MIPTTADRAAKSTQTGILEPAALKETARFAGGEAALAGDAAVVEASDWPAVPEGNASRGLAAMAKPVWNSHALHKTETPVAQAINALRVICALLAFVAAERETPRVVCRTALAVAISLVWLVRVDAVPAVRFVVIRDSVTRDLAVAHREFVNAVLLELRAVLAAAATQILHCVRTDSVCLGRSSLQGTFPTKYKQGASRETNVHPEVCLLPRWTANELCPDHWDNRERGWSA